MTDMRCTRSMARSGVPQSDSDDGNDNNYDLPVLEYDKEILAQRYPLRYRSRRTNTQQATADSEQDSPAAVATESGQASDHAGTPEPEPEDPVVALETHVSGVVEASRTLKKEYVKLREKYAEVQAELSDIKERLAEHERTRRNGRGSNGKAALRAVLLQKRVGELKGRVRELEKIGARDKKKIAKLEAREIKRDAEELQDQAEFELGDSVHVMRKLLRRFHDLMLANSLEDKQECAICLTALEVGKATSFPCQHIFCTPCVKRLIAAHKQPNGGNPYVSDEEEEQPSVPCPECRATAKPEDMETVEYTASTQWDALLEVAMKSAKLDRRRGDMDTSDEEEEEERVGGFIDDEDSEQASSSVMDNADLQDSEVPAEGSGQSSPKPTSLTSGREGKLRAESPLSEVERAIAARYPLLAFKPYETHSRSLSSTLSEADPARVEDSELSAGDLGRDEFEEGPSTPRRITRSYIERSFLQSPASEKRRRLEELADARQEKEKKRRLG